MTLLGKSYSLHTVILPNKLKRKKKQKFKIKRRIIKQCPKCKKYFLIKYFLRNNHIKSYCRFCRQIYQKMKRYYEKHEHYSIFQLFDK